MALSLDCKHLRFREEKLTTTKIKIDLKSGVIEAEGTESFVLGIYSDFKEQMTIAENTPNQTDTEKDKSKKKRTSPKKASPKKTIKNKPAGESTGKLVKELDLSASEDKQSLRDYYGQYKTKTNMERNLVFSYYLQHELDIDTIGIDEIFT